jgi:hypothetical protein
LGAEIDDTICGGSVFVPLRPPARRMVSKGFVGRVAAKEVTVVKASSEVVDAARVRIGLIEIDSDKVPAGAKSAWGTVRDEEKAVVGAQEGTVESMTRGQRSWWWENVAVNDGSRVEIREVDRERCGRRL